jgi:hypothetical protein
VAASPSLAVAVHVQYASSVELWLARIPGDQDDEQESFMFLHPLLVSFANSLLIVDITPRFTNANPNRN